MTTIELEALVGAAETENRSCFNYAKAEQIAREALVHIAKNDHSESDDLRIRALLALSESLEERGNAKDALPISQEALALSKNNIRPEIRILEAKALGHLGNVYHQLGDYSRALEFYEQSVSLNEEFGNKAGVAAHTGNIGNVYLYTCQYTKALESFKKVVPLFEELGKKAAAAASIGNIGVVYTELFEFPKALEYLERCVTLFDELGNRAGCANHVGNIGVVYRHLSEYARALEYFEKALALAAESGNSAGVARQMENIGDVYSELSEYAKALEYFERALALDKELDNKAGLATINCNIGNVLLALSQFSGALEYYESSLTIAENIGDRRTVGHALSQIGEVLRRMGRTKEAMEYLQRALRLSREEIEGNFGVAERLIRIGTLLAEEDRFAESIEKLEEGLALALRLGQKKKASEAVKQFADLYARQGDSAKELEYLKRHYALKEEIFSDESKKRIETFNMRLAIADERRETVLQRMRAERSEHQAKELLLRAELSEKELSNSTLQLVAQTEFLSELRNGLLKFIRTFPMPAATAKELRERLRMLPCRSVDWERFDMQFKAAHPEFAKRLVGEYASLSNMELRVCTLLRMNLRTAEIARLFCLSERTIEDHRASIRKKMKLQRTEDLNAYLMKL